MDDRALWRHMMSQGLSGLKTCGHTTIMFMSLEYISRSNTLSDIQICCNDFNMVMRSYAGLEYVWMLIKYGTQLKPPLIASRETVSVDVMNFYHVSVKLMTYRSKIITTWWRGNAFIIHDDVVKMEIFSASLAISAGNSPVPGEFPPKALTRNVDVFFDLRLNKRLSKQSWDWWFETPPRPLWCHRSVLTLCEGNASIKTAIYFTYSRNVSRDYYFWTYWRLLLVFM